jgi:hypothetical protein
MGSVNAYGKRKVPRYVLLLKLKRELAGMLNEHKREEAIKKQQNPYYVPELRLRETTNRN